MCTPKMDVINFEIKVVVQKGALRSGSKPQFWPTGGGLTINCQLYNVLQVDYIYTKMTQVGISKLKNILLLMHIKM